jgi:hypothetical protein
VKEFTIASTLQRMLQDVLAVGSDLTWLPMPSSSATSRCQAHDHRREALHRRTGGSAVSPVRCGPSGRAHGLRGGGAALRPTPGGAPQTPCSPAPLAPRRDPGR